MNKYLSTVRTLTLALALCAGFSSCSDDDDASFDVTTDIASAGFKYDQAGVWENVFTNDPINVQGFTFSHTGGSSEWGGVTFYSWAGFCPSCSTDKTDYSTSGFAGTHEWSSITGSGVTGSQYMIGFWKSDETPDIPNEAGTYITYGGNAFEPKEVYVTNNTYAYYTMLNGNSFSKKFTSEDWFDLIIHGSLNGYETAQITVRLANGTNISDNWMRVDLAPLGSVDRIYFTMASSDTGQWGMNTPSYFCLDRLSANID